MKKKKIKIKYIEQHIWSEYVEYQFFHHWKNNIPWSITHVAWQKDIACPSDDSQKRVLSVCVVQVTHDVKCSYFLFRTSCVCVLNSSSCFYDDRRQMIRVTEKRQISRTAGKKRKSKKSLHQNSEADEKLFKLTRLIKSLARHRTHQALLRQNVKIILARGRFLTQSRQSWKSEGMPSLGNEHCATSAQCLPRQRFVRVPPYAHPVRADAWRQQDFSDTATLTSMFMVKRRDPRPAGGVAVSQRIQEGPRPAFACQSGLAPELDPLDKPVEGHSTFFLCRSPPDRHQLQLLVRVDNSIIQIETCFFLQDDRFSRTTNAARERYAHQWHSLSTSRW